MYAAAPAAAWEVAGQGAEISTLSRRFVCRLHVAQVHSFGKTCINPVCGFGQFLILLEVVFEYPCNSWL
jgi:hypothetical protein